MQPAIFADPQRERFYETPPRDAAPERRTWYARGQNFLVEYNEVKASAVLERASQPDEYSVVLPDADTSVEVETSNEKKIVSGFSLCFIPPGRSKVTVPTGGRIVRVFTTKSDDLVAKCSNASAYADRHPNIPPFEGLPLPLGGFHIRSYSLDVPPREGRVGRIFACTTLMINFANPRMGPANETTKLSPHSHDDFEQGTLILDGSFTHHLRWPWTSKKGAWRDDEHTYFGAPSLVVIPAGVIHCSEPLGEKANQFLDVWSPPRLDYFDRGHVLNAADYR
jgi:mannose-6-phosphate isomerase-like protein (cupin superfamily)